MDTGFHDLSPLLESIAALLRRRGERLATAESCTGGLIAAACTSLAGSSDWFERGFVTYSNEAKVELLGVDAAAIARHGAVSEVVARAMAEGARLRARVAWSLAVTGVAGPGGGSPDKPVGTVWLALAGPGPTAALRLQLAGDRTAIRTATVVEALGALRKAIEAPSSE
jgi:nicotinamide-nucleotide amidase